MSRALIAAAASAALACGGLGGEQQTLYKGGDVTVRGCIGPHERDRAPVLWIVESPEKPVSSAVEVAQSTSLDGPWVGTRQLALTVQAGTDIEQYAGRRVEVSGTVPQQAGTSGPTDQIQNSREAQLRAIRVDSIRAIDGKCVFPRDKFDPATSNARPAPPTD